MGSLIVRHDWATEPPPPPPYLWASLRCHSPTLSRAKKLSVSVSGKGWDSMSSHSQRPLLRVDGGSLERSSLPPRAQTREPSHDRNGAPTLVQKWELELFTPSPCVFSLYIHLHISSWVTESNSAHPHLVTVTSCTCISIRAGACTPCSLYFLSLPSESLDSQTPPSKGAVMQGRLWLSSTA